MTQTIQFASSLSLESDLKKAALEAGADIERSIGKGPIDLMFVFPSSHHAG